LVIGATDKAAVKKAGPATSVAKGPHKRFPRLKKMDKKKLREENA